MHAPKLYAGFTRLDILEVRLCLPINHIARVRPVKLYIQTVSWLGNGPIWFSLLAALPIVYGPAALTLVLHMAVIAIAGVFLYKLLKGVLLRERPFASHAGVLAVSRPLDRYSFPSGHTLHATAFLALL